MTIKTPIGYTTRDDIFVRDRNIATEILGQLDFIDMIFLAATGQTPSAPMKRMANTLMVAVTDHGLTPSAIAARLTILGAPESIQGAVAAGILGSFSDAPGYLDQNNQLIPGSKLKEELREINYAGGLEYWYAKQFAFRTGYFYEHYTKGNRKYFTMGLGVRYSIFSLDFSYLIANTQRSPLANTLRFTLGFKFDKSKKAKPTE